MNTYYNRDSEKRRNSSIVSRPSPMPNYMNTNSTRFQSTSRDPLTSSWQSVRLRGRYPTNNEITSGPITEQTVDMLNERTRNLIARLAEIEERGRVQEEERRKAEEQERVAQEQEREWVARNKILSMQQQRERIPQYEILHMRQQERERAVELEKIAEARKETIMNQEEKTRNMIEKNRQLMNQEMSRTGTAILKKLRAVKEQERAEEQERLRIAQEQERLRLEIERVRAEEQERLRIAQERERAEEQERLRIAQERERAEEQERLRIAQERERAEEQER
jgi:trichohyalin